MIIMHAFPVAVFSHIVHLIEVWSGSQTNLDVTSVVY